MQITKKILGISAFYHDSAAALIIDGKIIAAAQEERFTREKHTADFPVNAIKYCLDEGGCSISELDAIVFYDKPLLKFERLLETYYAFAPRGLRSFLKAIPVWVKQKLFIKKLIWEGLEQIENFDRRKLTLQFTEHHFSHAASAFYPSPFEEAAILTIDGAGEWATASIAHGTGSKINLLKEMRFPHSVGLLYSSFTYYLGFKVNSGEYKLMGLAPFGSPNAPQTLDFINKIKTHLVSIQSDGSIALNQKYFDYATGLKMVNEAKWKALFGFPVHVPDSPFEPHHHNLAYAIQVVTEEIILKMAAEAKRITGSEYLCMAGGVALNCVANSKLLKANIFKDIFIQPAAGDAGGALGAALLSYYAFFNQTRIVDSSVDSMEGSQLGPQFNEYEILKSLKKQKAVFHRIDNFSALCQEIAQSLSESKIIGWFQGRMEYGPRALGSRSILADARDWQMQQKLNLNIKYRESFRPFAPAVLEEHVLDFFELDKKSPYMLFNADIKTSKRKALPNNYESLSWLEKLQAARSELPAITHLDDSARLQTVSKNTNPRFHQLLEAFYQKTNYPVIINTSFNVRGEPIVCTPEDAYRCFMQTEMDILVIEDYMLIKSEQPEYENMSKWKINFKPD